MSTHRDRLWIVLFWVLLVALGIVERLLPHPPNCTPMASLALFGGFYFASRWAALSAPLVALLISDAWLGSYEWPVLITVYASLMVPVLFRGWLRVQPSIGRVAVSTLACSTLFFISTNFAVWAFTPWYPLSVTGLIECFASALPFFRFTLLGDAGWALILFGGHAWATRAGWLTSAQPAISR